MKTLYILPFLLSSFLFYGQVIITELADPNNNSSARYVELYVIGPSVVDFTDWELIRYTNDNTTVSSSTIDLTSLGTPNVGSYIIIAANGTAFEAAFNTTADISAGGSSPANSNGDEKIAIRNNLGVIVDIFGIPGDNSTDANDAQNFEDGRAERKASVTMPNTVWNAAEWNTDNDQGFGSGAQDAPNGFDPKIWIGDANACGLIFNTPVITCATNTLNSDSVVINIPYNGMDSGITSLTTTSGGIIGGDNPATIPNGNITITGLSESASWDLLINGGNCNGNSISGTITSTFCNPKVLVINEFLADPNGDANMDGTIDTGDDEFIEIYNTGSNTVDMEGYTIEDALNVRHTFPSGTLLNTNNYITVFGGGMPDASLQGMIQVVSTSGLSLNNSGDTIILRDNADTIISQYTYGSEGNNNQSLARNPDFTGAFVQHSTISTNPEMFSPGRSNTTSVLSSGNFKALKFRVYPNPANSFINIEKADNEITFLVVYNLLGQEVLKAKLKRDKLDISDLEPGIYLLKLFQNNASITKKIIINK